MDFGVAQIVAVATLLLVDRVTEDWLRWHKSTTTAASCFSRLRLLTNFSKLSDASNVSFFRTRRKIV